MTVKLQQTVSDKGYAGERYAWKDGLLVTLDTIQAFLVRNEADNKISFCVSGDTCDVEIIWDVSKDTEVNITQTLDQYEGINAEIVYVCGHCLLLRKESPCYLSPQTVLNSTNPLTADVKCGDDSVPRGLVRAFPGKEEFIRQKKVLTECCHGQTLVKCQIPINL